MQHRSPNFTLTLVSRLLCTAVLFCALLVFLPTASIAHADGPENWPTVAIWIPPTHAPAAATNTPVLPTATTAPPVNTPTMEPPTAEPFTATPLPTFTSVPSDTPTDTDTPLPTDTPTETATATPSWLPPGPGCYVKPGKAALTLPVPYIHQVNDISSADGNWACGPTSVAMVLAYYSKLQPWPGSDASASADSGSQFAPYVTNVYTNSDHTYSALAADPQGKMVAGLYGTISPTGLADWSRIRQVLQWHGLTSQNLSVSFEGIKAALDRGHPVLIGNDLTAAGHVLVAIGYTSNDQLIVNDPYGNRFASGYGSNDGQGVYYAWSCMRAHNAVEVIGTYIPPATATSTPEPTGTSTTVPTSTATGTATVTATSTQAAREVASLAAATPKSPTNGSASLLNKAYSLVAGSTYNSASNAVAAIHAAAGPGKLFAVILLLLSVLGLVAGVYWLAMSRRWPKRNT
ncbi:MAG TPA: C39 family peptidase [Chloroflexia bacterium]|nr:C39 family peptidase [Chloroflexia bacterium]